MERENITVSRFSKYLVCIETIADGNCLIHSILKASNEDYQNTNNVAFRKNMAAHYRKLLSEAILKIDERYTSIEDMANMIRCEYKTESPRNFMEFLRTMYNYQTSYISYPNPFISDEEIKSCDILVLKNYINQYKDYLIKFNEKIETKSSKFIKSPSLNSYLSKNGDNYEKNKREEIEEKLSDIDFRNIQILRGIYKDLEEVIDSHVKNLKDILEKTLSYYLYLPTFYNEGVIEKALKYEEKDGEIIPVSLDKIPKGRYCNFPFNCFLFSASKATPLMKFEFEYNNLEGIVKLSDIPRHLDSRKFIGDGDALLYVPYLLCINLIVIDFRINSVLAIYENEHSDKYVIINNDNNVHFETIGIMVDDKISTIFDKDSEIVQECLKRNTSINLDFLENEN